APLNVPRVMLFFSTLLLVMGAAGIGFAAGRLGARRWGRPVAAGVLLLLVWHLAARPGAWASLERLPIEDVGPLIRLVEETRGPDDRVLVYGRSRYVY